jgi:hypothetical protein
MDASIPQPEATQVTPWYARILPCKFLASILGFTRHHTINQHQDKSKQHQFVVHEQRCGLHFRSTSTALPTLRAGLLLSQTAHKTCTYKNKKGHKSGNTPTTSVCLATLQLNHLRFRVSLLLLHPCSHTTTSCTMMPSLAFLCLYAGPDYR